MDDVDPIEAGERREMNDGRPEIQWFVGFGQDTDVEVTSWDSPRAALPNAVSTRTR